MTSLCAIHYNVIIVTQEPPKILTPFQVFIPFSHMSAEVARCELITLSGGVKEDVIKL